MGFFGWIWSIVKTVFVSEEVRIHEIETDIALDKEELKLDKRRRKTEKFENEDFSALTNNAYILYESLSQRRETLNYRDKLVSLIKKIKAIKDSPGITVEFTHLRELYSNIWQPLKPVLERDFGNDKVISKAIKEMD